MMTKHLPKNKAIMWFLMAVTILLGGFSLITASWLYRLRNESLSLARPESTPGATACSFSFTIPTPTLTPTPTPTPTSTPTPTLTPTPTPTPTPTLTPTPSIPPCSETTTDIVIAIDRSGTMGTQGVNGRIKLDWAKDAAIAFVNVLRNQPAAVQQNMRIGIVSWAGNNYRVGTLNPTNNWDSVVSYINSITYQGNADNYTCMECGITKAGALLSTPADQKVIIFMSDGIGNRIVTSCTSSDSSTCTNAAPCTNNTPLQTHCPAADQAAINAATAQKAAGVDIYTVGYGSRVDPITILENNLQAIASDPDSNYYLYGGNETNWANVFTQIAPRICSLGPTTGALPTVTTPTRLTPTADAYVNGSRSTVNTNYGTSASLLVDGSPVNTTYMKFDLTSLANKVVSKATLRLKVTDSSTGTQSIKSSTNTSWGETTINYSNRPTLSSTTINNIIGGLSGNWVQIDLTTFVNTNKGRVVTLAIGSTSSDGLTFKSKEAASERPELVVEH